MKSYHTNCVNSTAEKIDSMCEHTDNKEISYKKFMQEIDKSELIEQMPDYAWSKRDVGLRLKNDYHVSYFKSFYEGKECVYMVHSLIEYIFI